MTNEIPIVWGRMRTSLGQDPELRTVKILLDSGASQTILSKHLVRKLRINKTGFLKWNTTAGIMETNKTSKIHFSLPEFYEKTNY